jgi:hypothetical protein
MTRLPDVEFSWFSWFSWISSWSSCDVHFFVVSAASAVARGS